MKRALIASILGIAATAATTFGQGHVLFSTYYSSSQMGLVEYKAGGIVPSGFNAELYYGLGSNLSFASLTPLASTITPVGSLVAGVVTGGDAIMSNWSSGNVTFAIVAYNGTSYAASVGSPTLWATQGADIWTWTDGDVVSTSLPTNQFDYNAMAAAALRHDGTFPVIQVSLGVPEPGTFALAGLGAAALMIFRKRQ